MHTVVRVIISNYILVNYQTWIIIAELLSSRDRCIFQMSHHGLHRAISQDLLSGCTGCRKGLRGNCWDPQKTEQSSGLCFALPDLTANWDGSFSVIYAGNRESHTPTATFSACLGAEAWKKMCPPPAATQTLACWVPPSGLGTVTSHLCPLSAQHCPAKPNTRARKPSSESINLSFPGRVLTWV